ncbi:MAG: UPF0758 domain-containing protein [Halothiobacillaceae bacterium]
MAKLASSARLNEVRLVITDWPEDERPREKRLEHAPAALSDGHLPAPRGGTGADRRAPA